MDRGLAGYSSWGHERLNMIEQLSMQPIPKFVIAFLPRSKHLLIPWLQTLSEATDSSAQTIFPQLTNPFSCLPYKKWEGWQDLFPAAQTVMNPVMQVEAHLFEGPRSGPAGIVQLLGFLPLTSPFHGVVLRSRLSLWLMPSWLTSAYRH